MRKLTLKEWIAVCVGIVVVALLFFGGTIMDLFSTNFTSNAVTGPTNTIEPAGNPQAMNNISTVKGLEIYDEVVGTSTLAVPGKKVVVHYTGILRNGTKFDSSLDRGQPFSFDLGAGQVIKGWDMGVAGMRVGGVRRLVIAPELGYGSYENGPIPANSTLIFQVQLLGVN
jgi:FKBP-type peptidyl-prolyl cis-trans isomerase